MNTCKLPNLFILGAAKAGTTSLYHYLKQHPQIYLSSIKEPHFFDDDENFAKGLNNYVKQYFRNSEMYPITGEATPYIQNGIKVASRINQAYSNNPPKFVIILRDPVKRAWSHYMHRVRTGLETNSFEDALLRKDSKLGNDHDPEIGLLIMVTVFILSS